MDLEMPIMDGLTCTQRIRELERSGQVIGHVPIIAVTANARAGQIDVALGSGMVRFISPDKASDKVKGKADDY